MSSRWRCLTAGRLLRGAGAGHLAAVADSTPSVAA
jgi:hypothetical protein